MKFRVTKHSYSAAIQHFVFPSFASSWHAVIWLYCGFLAPCCRCGILGSRCHVGHAGMPWNASVILDSSRFMLASHWPHASLLPCWLACFHNAGIVARLRRAGAMLQSCCSPDIVLACCLALLTSFTLCIIRSCYWRCRGILIASSLFAFFTLFDTSLSCNITVNIVATLRLNYKILLCQNFGYFRFSIPMTASVTWNKRLTLQRGKSWQIP